MGEKVIFPHMYFEDENGNYAYTQLNVEVEVLSPEEMRNLFPEDYEIGETPSVEPENNVIPFPTKTGMEVHNPQALNPNPDRTSPSPGEGFPLTHPFTRPKHPPERP